VVVQGQSAGLIRAKLFGLAGGTVDVDGGTAVLRVVRPFALAAGVVIAAGLPVALTVNRVITAQPGTVVVQGFDVDITTDAITSTIGDLNIRNARLIQARANVSFPHAYADVRSQRANATVDLVSALAEISLSVEN
jgi:hypothetical protein